MTSYDIEDISFASSFITDHITDTHFMFGSAHVDSPLFLLSLPTILWRQHCMRPLDTNPCRKLHKSTAYEHLLIIRLPII